MFDQLCQAKDAFDEIRRKFGRGEATYDEMRAAAVAVLTLRQAAEVTKYGKVKTKITAQTIASFMRG